MNILTKSIFFAICIRFRIKNDKFWSSSKNVSISYYFLIQELHFWFNIGPGTIPWKLIVYSLHRGFTAKEDQKRKQKQQAANTKDFKLPREVASYGEGIQGGWGLTDERSKKTSGEDSAIPKPCILVNPKP